MLHRVNPPGNTEHPESVKSQERIEVRQLAPGTLWHVAVEMPYLQFIKNYH